MDAEDVKLISEEGTAFSVLHKVALMSATLKNLMEDDANTGEGIPLPTVGKRELERVITWANYHVNDPAPEPVAATVKLELSDKPPAVSEWDKAFCDAMDQEAMFKTILAANYLDMRQLLDLCCRSVALQVLGLEPSAIYRLFKVEQVLTEAEEKMVRDENPWLADQ